MKSKDLQASEPAEGEVLEVGGLRFGERLVLERGGGGRTEAMGSPSSRELEALDAMESDFPSSILVVAVLSFFTVSNTLSTFLVRGRASQAGW